MLTITEYERRAERLLNAIQRGEITRADAMQESEYLKLNAPPGASFSITPLPPVSESEARKFEEPESKKVSFILSSRFHVEIRL